MTQLNLFSEEQLAGCRKAFSLRDNEKDLLKLIHLYSVNRKCTATNYHFGHADHSPYKGKSNRTIQRALKTLLDAELIYISFQDKARRKREIELTTAGHSMLGDITAAKMSRSKGVSERKRVAVQSGSKDESVAAKPVFVAHEPLRTYLKPIKHDDHEKWRDVLERVRMRVSQASLRLVENAFIGIEQGAILMSDDLPEFLKHFLPHVSESITFTKVLSDHPNSGGKTNLQKLPPTFAQSGKGG